MVSYPTPCCRREGLINFLGDSTLKTLSRTRTAARTPIGDKSGRGPLLPQALVERIPSTQVLDLMFRFSEALGESPDPLVMGRGMRRWGRFGPLWTQRDTAQTTMNTTLWRTWAS